MMLWRSPLPQSEPTPESWQILYKWADFLAHCSLPPGRTEEVAAKKNSTLANVMSLDHSWSHTRRIIIICRTREFIKLFVIFTKSSVLFFFLQYTPPVSSRWLPATLFFSDVNLHCLCYLKRSHNMGCGSVWSLSLRKTVRLFLSPYVAKRPIICLLNSLSWSQRHDSLKALNLVSIEDEVKLSTQMRWLSPFANAWVWSSIVLQKKDIISWQDALEESQESSWKIVNYLYWIQGF